MDIFEWIQQELKPKACNSEEFIYDDMDSQSGHSLPIIYQPFDANRRSHWQDRGSLFDYVFSTQGKRLLDFGPGDGWPSLIVAPYVDQVVGIDGSLRRVQVCAENARRLGISNAKFIHVFPRAPLPFPDNSFDGVVVASSVEQTPDPKAALRELLRVLRPKGHLRMAYEALGVYRGGRERETWLCPFDHHTCRLILYDRHVDRELVRQYGLTFALSADELTKSLCAEGQSLSFDVITIALLEKVRAAITDARVCSLTHPCGRTFVSWLKDVGFREIIPSHSGAEFAGQLFDQLGQDHRPKDVNGIDAMLKPLLRIVVEMVAPVTVNPMITAIK